MAGEHAVQKMLAGLLRAFCATSSMLSLMTPCTLAQAKQAGWSGKEHVLALSATAQTANGHLARDLQ